MDELTKWVLEQTGVKTDDITPEQADAIMAGQLGVVHRVVDDGLVTDLLPVMQPAEAEPDA